jgi:hypothetical protein
MRSTEVVDRGKELCERLGRRGTLLDLMWMEWSAFATSARGEEATELGRRYCALTLDDPDPVVRSQGHEILGVLHWHHGRISDAVAALDAARALVEPLPVPEAAFQAEQRMIIEVFWIFNHAMAGDMSADEALARYDDLVGALPDRFSVASICGFAVTLALTLGHWDGAERFVGIGMAADPSAQFAFWNGQLLMQDGVVRVRRGDVEGGLASFADGKARYLELGARSGLVTFESALESGLLIAEAVVAVASGDRDEASAKVSEAASVAARQGATALVDRARAAAETLGLPVPG